MRLRIRKSIWIPIALLIAAVPLGLYWLQSWSANSELADLVAELDRRGEPWRLADLQAQRLPIADERNSAALIASVKPGNFWKIFPDDKDFELLPCRELPADVAIKLRDALEQFDANVQEARRLARFPEGRFTYKIAPDVISTLIPHVQNVREVAMLLKHDALWQIQQGDFEQAAASCKAAVYAARSLRDELFLISHLVRHAILRQAADVVERLCAQGQPTDKVLRQLQQLFAEEAAYDGWTLALQGERAGMHELFTVIAAGKVDMRFVRSLTGMGRVSWRDWLSDYVPGPTTQQSHAWLLKHFNELLAASKLPPVQRSARLRELDKLSEQAPAPAKALLLTPWKRIIYPKQRLDVKLSATVAGLAAERYRLERGAWPESLAALMPEYLPKLPTDPYTGAPLQMKSTFDGVVIFCSGPDGSWQGDAWDLPLTTPEWGERHEHEFRLWDPGKRRAK